MSIPKTLLPNRTVTSSLFKRRRRTEDPLGPMRWMSPRKVEFQHLRRSLTSVGNKSWGGTLKRPHSRSSKPASNWSTVDLFRVTFTVFGLPPPCRWGLPLFTLDIYKMKAHTKGKSERGRDLKFIDWDTIYERNISTLLLPNTYHRDSRGFK